MGSFVHLSIIRAGTTCHGVLIKGDVFTVQGCPYRGVPPYTMKLNQRVCAITKYRLLKPLLLLYTLSISIPNKDSTVTVLHKLISGNKINLQIGS